MNGILIVDKPEGFTSHDCIGKVRKILRQKAVGHTGTLDPFATGVLVILLGRATRLAQFLDKAEKEYLATIRFGFETDTGDRTGTPKAVQSPKFKVQSSEIENALAKFRGEFLQTPPMYSAKKIAGKKLYELARKGVEIERQPVKINISKLEVVELQTATEELQISVTVSAGTYIRVLAEDVGRELGVGAHLAELRRTRAGFFDLSRAVTFDELEELAAEKDVEQALISPNQALVQLPFIVLDENAVNKVMHGSKCLTDLIFADNQLVRMNDERENLIAIGVFEETTKAIQPRVVLATDENGG